MPDLELLRDRHPSLRSVEFSAGLGPATTHLGLWCLAGLVRAGWIRRIDSLAGPLHALATRLERLGNGVSAMYVRMTGTDAAGKALYLRWELIARTNHGIRIPCVIAIAPCRKFADGWQTRPGARPCVGEVTLDECLAELQGLDVTTTCQEC